MGLLDRWLAPSLPRIEGAGVVLRLPQERDYEAWRSLREASRGFLTPWEPLWTADELSRRAFRQRLLRYRQDARERSAYTLFLFEAATGTLLGGITVGQIRRGVAQSCTLGYWMGEVHAGSGWMYRAVEALKPFIFEVEGLHRIEAACLPSNERSIRLLEKSGFRREGYLRNYLKIAGHWEDHHLYSHLAEDRTRPGAAPRLQREAQRGSVDRRTDA
ncbi:MULTISPECIES: GNAT family N-acetyltransferase [unclassified Aureimonas]|uniref:GNAT family N-acetyltransferase n=1 Tax=unclassified Aureimonas TaxID=2615206 RepID=UPI0006F71517|nr:MULTISPECIES: GNAT family protein [unclassified Aureimonas]KQT61294.1 GCN5 family acetyltransferase [Aureimonas sp. Leaf460]KQT68743.1 GCN5 family acetyltransferase [Aureimonas sp. Leaf427]